MKISNNKTPPAEKIEKENHGEGAEEQDEQILIFFSVAVLGKCEIEFQIGK